MKEFVEYVVKGLVDHPAEVVVTQRDDAGGVTFDLRCNRDDIGMVIGKGGRTIKAIRALLGVAATKARPRVGLEIVEQRPAE